MYELQKCNLIFSIFFHTALDFGTADHKNACIFPHNRWQLLQPNSAPFGIYTCTCRDLVMATIIKLS